MPKFSLVAFVCFLVSVGLIGPQRVDAASGEGNGNGREKEEEAPESYVHNYIKVKLGVSDLDSASHTYRIQKMLDRKNASLDDPKVVQQIYDEYFAEISAPAIARIFRSFALTEYPNNYTTGSAGTGKTFLIDQITILFSFGIMPDYLKKELNITGDPDNMADLVAKAFFKNTQVIQVDENLLSHSVNNGPAATEEVRMKTTLLGLIGAAKRDFLRTDGKSKRTIFVLNEAKELPDYIHNALKAPLDHGGFLLNPKASLRRQDPGYHVWGLTTTDEWRRLVKGDGAIQRRYIHTTIAEPDDAEAFRILRNQADGFFARQYPNLTIPDEPLRYIVYMKNFLDWPPLAAPASPKSGLNQLITWKMHHPGHDSRVISLKDTQQWLMGKASLTPIWFEGPNGEPPMTGLADEIKKYVIDQDEVIESFAESFTAWYRMGMPRKEIPVYLWGTITGGGKDTLLKAINMVLFNHDAHELNVDIGGVKGFGIEALTKGPPTGNHDSGQPGRLVEALAETRGTGIIGINEAADADEIELDKFKVILEQGEIRPAGPDSRPRPIRFPVVLMGQWGEEFFSDPNAADYDSLTQEQIDQFFLKGNINGHAGRGKVSRALLDRAKKTGGVHLLRPVRQEFYPQLVRVWMEEFKKNYLNSNDYEFRVTDKFIDAIAEIGVKANFRAREMYPIAVDMTRGAFSKAQEQGAPMRHLRITLDYQNGEIYMLASPKETSLGEIDGGGDRKYVFKVIDVIRNRKRISKDLRAVLENGCEGTFSE